jgi:hypothetical protein
VDIQSLFIYKEISSFLNLKFTWKKMWSSFQLIGHSKDYMATVHSGYTNEMWPDFSVNWTFKGLHGYCSLWIYK